MRLRRSGAIAVVHTTQSHARQVLLGVPSHPDQLLQNPSPNANPNGCKFKFKFETLTLFSKDEEICSLFYCFLRECRSG